jgi:teichuronic acid biosynthesis glycosyltransferase TuaH
VNAVPPIQPSMPERLKLVVLDANFYWTEQLFSACRSFADVLLLKPRDYRAFRNEHGRLFFDHEPRPLGDGVWEQRGWCPPGWLFHYWPLTQKVLARYVRRFQKSANLIFVYSYPYYHSLVRQLNCKAIYYNIDDYSDYWPEREERTKKVEMQAVANSDLTICVSHYRALLLSELEPEAAKVYHLPHGCSPDFMVESPLTGPAALPWELQLFERPIAGYIGALNDRFDFAYLYEVAHQLPKITFILGGKPPQEEDGPEEWWSGVERARQLPNVYFIGHVPHDRLGEYLHSFDVLLMMYSKTRFNLNCCPTKLWDYMGTSLPIVANDVVPEVSRWGNVFLVSQTPSQFASNIQFALSNPLWQSSARLEVARANTWQKQSEKLRALISERGWLNGVATS